MQEKLPQLQPARVGGQRKFVPGQVDRPGEAARQPGRRAGKDQPGNAVQQIGQDFPGRRPARQERIPLLQVQQGAGQAGVALGQAQHLGRRLFVGDHRCQVQAEQRAGQVGGQQAGGRLAGGLVRTVQHRHPSPGRRLAQLLPGFARQQLIYRLVSGVGKGNVGAQAGLGLVAAQQPGDDGLIGDQRLAQQGRLPLPTLGGALQQVVPDQRRFIAEAQELSQPGRPGFAE